MAYQCKKYRWTDRASDQRVLFVLSGHKPRPNCGKVSAVPTVSRKSFGALTPRTIKDELCSSSRADGTRLETATARQTKEMWRRLYAVVPQVG